MNNLFEKEIEKLYEEVTEFINISTVAKATKKGEKFEVEVPKEFKNKFFKLIDKVNLALMEDKENFYGYFLFQMERSIKFDISGPTSINFRGARYVIHFNPLIFLNLNIKQMETEIKHEILHILSNHLIRAKELENKYSTLAINLSMDIVVNQYLDYLPPHAVTLEYINSKYDSLNLEPYKTLEEYVDKIQTELDLQDYDEDGDENDNITSDDIKTEFDIEKTHDDWRNSDEIDEKTFKELTEKFIDNANKGIMPVYLNTMIKSLRSEKGELPWNLYLKKLMGTVEANKKKTITRRNRRQPSRLDLRGELRGHKAEIAVAIDISGSISDEEFKQAIKEVLNIVKNHNREITIIECDKEIKRVYKAKSIRDIKERSFIGGGTKFTPVFEYANSKHINLLIYFTDGKGETSLEVIPKGYKVLWIISGRGDEISLKNPYGAVKKLKKVEMKIDETDMNDVRQDGYSMNNQQPML